MLALLDTSQDYDAAAAELGAADVGQLLTPLTRYADRGRARFAIDNGAYSGFKVAPFTSLLARQLPHRERCLFVAAPDVVASARRTLEVFRVWQPRLAADGWPVALVAQDGIEDLDIPWHQMKAVFIGGTTEFKLGAGAVAVIRAAQALGKWVHVGRVNTPARWDKFEELGVDSIDGTGLSRYGHMRRAIALPQLFDPSEAELEALPDCPGCTDRRSDTHSYGTRHHPAPSTESEA